MRNALTFIIEALGSVYILLLLLRFWLPIVHGNFANSFAQAILRLTSPVVTPLRRVVPPLGSVDTALILVTIALQYLLLLVVFAIRGLSPGIGVLLVLSLLELAILSVQIFSFAIIIQVILSWIAPGQNNPLTAIIHQLAEPVLRPFRRVIPSLGGIDISPLIALILLQALVIVLRSLP